MTTRTKGFVGTERAAQRIKQLSEQPGAKERIEGIRKQMRDADRLYVENLAAIRRAADLTQTELAERMGTAQSEISRIERRPDNLLSTLAAYLGSVGEHPRVVVTVNGVDVELDLTSRAERA
jgi:ribosome-binding protein aMBF1 (putative translation factor)